MLAGKAHNPPRAILVGEGDVGKGFFTQGVAVLLKAPVGMAELVPLLEGFKITGKREASGSWQTSGPSLLVEYRPEVNGTIQIDLVDRPWPDSMGGVNADKDLFAAWSMGHFGPFAFPGSLERACQHCYTWRDGPPLVFAHKAFLRVRVTYTLGAEQDQPVIPRNTSAAQECEMVLGIVEALLEHPSAICYFNPNGEVLAPLQGMAEVADHYRKGSLPAVSLLANRRMVKFEGSDWMMMDLVGLDQIDLIDIEVCFTERYDPNEVAVFLINTALYLAKNGLVVKDGHTLTGPKGVLFEARKFSEPKLVPPREVLRFRPRDGTVSPTEIGFGDKPLGKRAWWQFWKL